MTIMGQCHIIIGLTPQGLALLRALAKEGYDVYAFSNSKDAVGYYSRYGVKKLFTRVSELRHDILVLKRKYAKIKCHIVSGELLAYMLDNFPDLYDICDVESGPYPLVARLSKKNQMYAYAEAKGLTVASHVLMSDCKPYELQYPVIVKRDYEVPSSFKTCIIRTADDMFKLIAEIDNSKKKYYIIQNLIQSNRMMDISCQVYCREGEILASLVCQQARRADGITSFIIELDDTYLISRVLGIVKQFLSGTVYSGFAEIELIYLPDSGSMYFIEINTRACGLHSAMHYKYRRLAKIVNGEFSERDLKPTAARLYWVNLARDMMQRIHARDFSKLAQLLIAKEDIFSWDDPLPFFSLVRRIGRS